MSRRVGLNTAQAPPLVALRPTGTVFDARHPITPGLDLASVRRLASQFHQLQAESRLGEKRT